MINYSGFCEAFDIMQHIKFFFNEAKVYLNAIAVVILHGIDSKMTKIQELRKSPSLSEAAETLGMLNY